VDELVDTVVVEADDIAREATTLTAARSWMGTISPSMWQWLASSLTVSVTVTWKFARTAFQRPIS